MKGYKKTLLITGGTISVGLGLIGIFIPVLPTTPFLLLAAFCFSRSSKRFHDRLLSNKFTGKYISNYVEGRGVTLRHKIMALSLLWTLISYSALFAVDKLLFKIFLFAIAIGVTIHLLKKKTYRPKRK